MAVKVPQAGSRPTSPSPRLPQVPPPHSPTHHPLSQPAGYCGLDKVELFPEETALAGVDKQRLLDVRIYCDNSVANGVVIMLALGTILRLLTALALVYCSRGIRLEPIMTAAGRLLGCVGRRGRRRCAAAAAAAAAGDAADQVAVAVTA